MVTERMLLEADASTLSAFVVALRTEAAARGLAVNVEEDRMTGDVRVRWKPDPARKRPNRMTRM